MGIMNLLKAEWSGKVGQTVGAKWKDKSTIRSFTKPANPRSPAQREVRSVFSDLTKTTALFADQIKTLSPLNTKGMSVRNAIIQLNKPMFAAGQFEADKYAISRGGLPNVSGFTATVSGGGAQVALSWTKATAPNITTKAKLVAVLIDRADNTALVITDEQTKGAATSAGTFKAGEKVDVYYYLVDWRGSSKVGSPSAHLEITAA
jgi:hypothetical protein